VLQLFEDDVKVLAALRVGVKLVVVDHHFALTKTRPVGFNRPINNLTTFIKCVPQIEISSYRR
jgi:hypothetical protein